LEKNSNLKNYGTADGNNPRQVAPVIPFVSDEFIENETFKWVFLSIGICITSVIFYISTR
jgi:hypothetical protein